jgi:hypothetical protein
MKGYVFVLAGLLVASCAWGADANGADPNREDTTVVNANSNTVTTTVEVKDGAVVVKSSGGTVAAKPGESVVVNGPNLVKVNKENVVTVSGVKVSTTHDPNHPGDPNNPSVHRSSSSQITINGKTIHVTSDGDSVNANCQNGQITIQCGGVTFTGDMNTLKAGDKTYDISKSNNVKISIQNGQVTVDTEKE